MIDEPEISITFDPREENFSYSLSWDHLEPAGMHDEKCRVWLYATEEEPIMALGLEKYVQSVRGGYLVVHCGSIWAMDNFYSYLRDNAPELVGTFQWSLNNHDGLLPAPRYVKNSWSA